MGKRIVELSRFSAWTRSFDLGKDGSVFMERIAGEEGGEEEVSIDRRNYGRFAGDFDCFGRVSYVLEFLPV